MKNRTPEKSPSNDPKWLELVLSGIGEGVIAADEEGQVQFINPAAVELVGWSAEEALGRQFHDIFRVAEEKPLERPAGTNGWEETKRNFEATLITKAGHSVPILANISPIQDENGRTSGNVLVFRNIAGQKKSLREIQLQANRAEILLEVALQLNNQLDIGQVLNQLCKITNQALQARATTVFLLDPKRGDFRRMAAYTADEGFRDHESESFVLGREFLETLLVQDDPVIVVPDIQSHTDWPYIDLIRARNIDTVVLAGLFRRDQLMGALVSIMADGQEMLPAEDVALLQGLANQASGAIENAELFDKVRMGRERQRMLAKSLVEIQEAERRHIAQDLHDHLGQVLTGLQFMLESVKNQVNEGQKEEISEIQKTVGDVIEQVREISLRLRPSMLDDMGLIPTLQWHFARYTNQTGIVVKFQHDKFTGRMPPEIETAAYRIIQEALTNVARYANVRDVFVGIALYEDSVWLEILDKGRGFNTAAVMERPSSGLGGMRERAGMAGGFLVVESYIDQGTQIVAALPLSDRPIERRKNVRKNPAG